MFKHELKNFDVPSFPKQDFTKKKPTTKVKLSWSSTPRRSEMDGNTYASLPCIAGKIKRFRWYALAPLKLLFTSCRT
jgi:hypothetical protein